MTFEETALMLYARQLNKQIVSVQYTPIEIDRRKDGETRGEAVACQ